MLDKVQSRFIDRISTAMSTEKYEAMQSADAANTGVIYAMRRDNEDVVAKIGYSFQVEDAMLCLKARNFEVRFHFNYEDTDRWVSFRKLVEAVMRSPKRIETDVNKYAHVYVLSAHNELFEARDPKKTSQIKDLIAGLE